MFKKIAVAAALTLLAASSFAADKPRFYAGGDIGSTKHTEVDGRYTSYGAFGGYQVNNNFGLEASYRSLASEGGVSLNQTAFSMVIGANAEGEFERVSLYGRLGFNRFSASGIGSDNTSNTKFLAGVGVGYDFSRSFTGRIEIQRPVDHLSNLNVGLAYRF